MGKIVLKIQQYKHLKEWKEPNKVIAADPNQDREKDKKEKIQDKKGSLHHMKIPPIATPFIRILHTIEILHEAIQE